MFCKNDLVRKIILFCLVFWIQWNNSYYSRLKTGGSISVIFAKLFKIARIKMICIALHNCFLIDIFFTVLGLTISIRFLFIPNIMKAHRCVWYSLVFDLGSVFRILFQIIKSKWILYYQFNLLYQNDKRINFDVQPIAIYIHLFRFLSFFMCLSLFYLFLIYFSMHICNFVSVENTCMCIFCKKYEKALRSIGRTQDAGVRTPSWARYFSNPPIFFVRNPVAVIEHHEYNLWINECKQI